MTDPWFLALFEDHYALLYRIGRVFLGSSHTNVIEDEIQETFLKAWKHEAKLKQHPNPSGWLVLTFRRGLMAQCRKLGHDQKHTAFSMDEEHSPDIADPSAQDFFQPNEHYELLQTLLGKRDAELFVRYCIQNEKAKDLAKEFDMSESGVRVRITRLKKKLLAHQDLFLCVVALVLSSLKAGGKG